MFGAMSRPATVYYLNLSKPQLLPWYNPSHFALSSPKTHTPSSACTMSHLVDEDTVMEDQRHYVDDRTARPAESDSSGSSGEFEPSPNLVRLVHVVGVDHYHSLRHFNVRGPGFRASQAGGSMPLVSRSQKTRASSVEGMGRSQKPGWVNRGPERRSMNDVFLLYS